jgi:hypothetical protein
VPIVGSSSCMNILEMLDEFASGTHSHTTRRRARVPAGGAIAGRIALRMAGWMSVVCLSACSGEVADAPWDDDATPNAPVPHDAVPGGAVAPAGGGAQGGGAGGAGGEPGVGSGLDDPGPAGNGGTTSGGGGVGGANGGGGAGGSKPVDPGVAAIVPTRIRRLSNLEYANSVRALLGTSEPYEDTLPADVRQKNFTANQAQTVSSDWNAEVERAAKAAAQAFVSGDGLNRYATCRDDNDQCAAQFIDAFAGAAFRRPVTDPERNGLLVVYNDGASEGGFSKGVELVVATVLQAPSFLYLTELGTNPSVTPEGQVTELTGDEMASLLSYVVTQGPPDAALIEAGRSGALADPAVRSEHARRLLGTEAGKKALENRIVEWFTTDWVLKASKDRIAEFNQFRPQLLEESRALVRTVIDEYHADFKTLLTADFTVASQEVSSYYGLSGSGRVSLTGTPRLGIMTSAAFLGGHSSPTESSPVKRGAAFMRQVLCTDPPDPSTVNLTVAAPPPDPSKSTRQLFEAHSADATCAACHSLMDPIGFAFEEFDEGGRVRKGPEDNNGYPVDASGSVTLAGTTYTWSTASEFISRVADSELAQRCVARTATRFGFAWTNAPTELAFVEEWQSMDVGQRTRIDEVLVKLIESDLFVQRRGL